MKQQQGYIGEAVHRIFKLLDYMYNRSLFTYILDISLKSLYSMEHEHQMTTGEKFPSTLHNGTYQSGYNWRA
ncbi:hypothetical protein PKOR_16275 [Pontibacter korlensis]|uniref:Uncharacterized protein n=1 Tax=Pontibacter korlensis TaxID=400092 RepID=A0A0E3ZGT0_9BACT|nr:hypothetical protein PKOR_16275 [Pontibacter korlensis]